MCKVSCAACTALVCEPSGYQKLRELGAVLQQVQPFGGFLISKLKVAPAACPSLVKYSNICQILSACNRFAAAEGCCGGIQWHGAGHLDQHNHTLPSCGPQLHASMVQHCIVWTTVQHDDGAARQHCMLCFQKKGRVSAMSVACSTHTVTAACMAEQAA